MLRLSRATPATLDVLRSLLHADEATWGLRIVGETHRPAGSIYPILARLEESGWVASRWDESAQRGPRRRLYELTEEGRRSADAAIRQAAFRAARNPVRRSDAGDLGVA